MGSTLSDPFRFGDLHYCYKGIYVIFREPDKVIDIREWSICGGGGLERLFIVGFFCLVLLLFYAIATVFQLYLGSDMIHEMRKRKPQPILLPTQRIFNIPHDIGMV